MVVYIKSVDKNCNISTTFVGNFELKDVHVDAGILFERVKSCLIDLGLDMKKLIGFGSDGASIMTGM